MDRPRRGGIWILGLAGFGTNVGWGMNKIFTAVILGARGAALPLIGVVLGLQGLFGIILNPVTGFLSDRLETRLGRRRPFLLIGFPGAALALILLYFARSLTIALAAVIAFYFFQQLSQAPYLAMMPDTYDHSEYGKAAGALNVLWMLGTLISFLVVPIVWQFLGHLAAFVLGAVVLAVSGLITAVYSHDTPRQTKPRSRSNIRPFQSVELWKYLIAQALWWLGFPPCHD